MQDVSQTGNGKRPTRLVCSEAGWPVLEIPSAGDDEASALGTWGSPAALYGTIKRSFADNGLGIEVIGHSRTLLLDHGVLEVPVLMAQGDLGVAVYLYPNGDPVDAAHFAGVQLALQRMDFLPPLYYAPAPLPAARPINPLRAFDVDLFRPLERTGLMPNGTYAMWWPTDDEALFCTSRTYDYIAQTYQALSGIESYFLAKVLRGVGLLPPDQATAERVPLAAKPWIVPLFGPELVPVYFVADDQRGIQFYLHAEGASRVYRERFWRHLLELVMRERQALERRSAPLDEYPGDTPNPLNWWLLAERTVQMRESQGAQMEYFGGLEALLEETAGEAPDTPPAATVADEPTPRRPAGARLLTTVLVVLLVAWALVAAFTLLQKPSETPPAPPVLPGLTGGPPALLPATDSTVAELLSPNLLPAADSAVAESATAPASDSGVVPIALPATPLTATAPLALVPPPMTPTAAVEPVTVPPVAPSSTTWTLQGLPQAAFPFGRSTLHVQFGSDGNSLVVLEKDTARVLDLRRRQVLRSIAGHLAAVDLPHDLQASHLNGTNSVSVAKFSSGQQLHSLRPVSGPLRELLFAADGQLLATLGAHLQLWDLATGNQLLLREEFGALNHLAFNPEATQLVGFEEGQLTVVDVATGERLARLALAVAEPRQVVFSGDGKQLLVTYRHGLLRLSAETQAELGRHERTELNVTSLASARDGQLIALLGDNLRGWLYHAEQWHELELPPGAQQVALSPEGSFLALRYDRRVVAWDISALLEPTPAHP